MNNRTAAVLAVALTALLGIANAAAGNADNGLTLSSPDEGGPVPFSQCTFTGDTTWVCFECVVTSSGVTLCKPVLKAPLPGGHNLP